MKKIVFFAFLLLATIAFMSSCERNDNQEWKMINDQWWTEWEKEVKAYNDTVDTIRYRPDGDKIDTIRVYKYQTTESGLIYKVILDEGLRYPNENSYVKVTYTGSFINGRSFDSISEPTWLKLTQLVPGWLEGLKTIKDRGKIKLYVPYTLGYGESGSGSIPPYSMLVFDVHLHDSLY